MTDMHLARLLCEESRWAICFPESTRGREAFGFLQGVAAAVDFEESDRAYRLIHAVIDARAALRIYAGKVRPQI